MPATIQLDDRQVSLDRPLSILALLAQEERKLSCPKLCQEQEWINNARCPLVNLIEVDEQVVPLFVWSERLVQDGMVIQTRSQQLESVQQERLRHLRDHQQCQFIRQTQEFVAAEAESRGLIDLEKRAQWQFEPRVSAPSIFHDPNCMRPLPGVCRHVQHDARRRRIERSTRKKAYCSTTRNAPVAANAF